MDWTDACDALERLELAHLVERQHVAQVLDELTADPLLSLSVEISPETLSADPAGQPVAWAELLGRLRRDRDLARRLFIDTSSTIVFDTPAPPPAHARDVPALLTFTLADPAPAAPGFTGGSPCAETPGAPSPTHSLGSELCKLGVGIAAGGRSSISRMLARILNWSGRASLVRSRKRRDRIVVVRG